jgi:hypothetical protein
MNYIGMIYKNQKDYIICNSIVEIDNQLHISEEVKVKKDDLFDLSAYGISSEQLVHSKSKNYRKMEVEEIRYAMEEMPSLKHLIEYLRDDKINQILK